MRSGETFPFRLLGNLVEVRPEDVDARQPSKAQSLLPVVPMDEVRGKRNRGKGIGREVLWSLWQRVAEEEEREP